MIRQPFVVLFRFGMGLGALAMQCVAYAAVSTADQTFVTTAMQGGMAEAEFGRLAEQRGNIDAVKRFGAQMVKDHTEANAALASEAKAIGATLPTLPNPKQQDTLAKFQDLRGPDFDKAYADAMVKDHEETVALFEREASSSGHDALRAYAQKTLPTLNSHLQMAEDLKRKTK